MISSSRKMVFLTAALVGSVWFIPEPAAALRIDATVPDVVAATSGVETVVARRTVVRRPGGGVRRTTVVRPGVVRPGWHGGGTRWVRPAHYWWRPGAAVAAGAAVGFVTAATAAAWAGPAPAPGYCWFYTDPSRTQGFWDRCP